MAELECTDSSIATSFSTPNWWDYTSSSLSSWNTSPWHQTTNPTSNSSCEDRDISISTTSFTNTNSNHSSLYDLIGGEHTSDNHLWNDVFMNVESNGAMHSRPDVKENLLDSLTPRSLSTAIFEPPAFDYLKKMDTNWESTNPTTSLSNFNKHFTGFTDNFIESERLTKLSNLVCKWSIAPPDPDHQFHCQQPLLTSSLDQYLLQNYFSQEMKQPLISIGTTNRNNSCLHSFYDHDLKEENEGYCEIGTVPRALLRSSFNSNGSNMFGLSSSAERESTNFDNGMSFRSRISKPIVDLHAAKNFSKSLNLADCKKQRSQTTSLSKNNGRERGIANEGKKKRLEDNSLTAIKKSKHESSTVSSIKMQAPKVKLTERITALQQIVSPFGKTDTASVLFEAIGYIKFLQEQVQLLSNPYMKSNTSKDLWGNFDRKGKANVKLDLKSRGLCLVPISCTPQVCRENTGSDYWTPTYRGCLYR